MEFRIRFTDPLVGCSRQSIEEEVEQWLGTSGEIVGGGAATNGSWANIDVAVKDQLVLSVGLAGVVNQLRAVLRTAKAPASTKITAFVSDDKMEQFAVG
jgi:hypothetical protein